MVPKSSHVNILQLEQECWGGSERPGVSWAGEVKRSQKEFRTQGQFSHPAHMLAESLGLEIRKGEEVWGGSNSKAEGRIMLITLMSSQPNILCVIAGEYSSQMPR